ncbi:MAG: T9SS type A sorting domain-containing protein [Calditrichaeota bacterium]|nr:T9SS type A sorting domain-containing protein [Calditrichota bacterium]
MKRINFLHKFGLILMAVLVLNSFLFAQQRVNVLIAYYSFTGNTEQMASGVEEGALKVQDVAVTKKKVTKVTASDLQNADGIILGSPTYFANIAGPMKTFVDNWAFKFGVYFGDKVGGAFSTGDMRTGGKEFVVISLLLAMMNNGMIVVGPVYQVGGVNFGGFGASAMTGAPDQGISDSELDDARKLGQRVATIARRLKYGTPVYDSNNSEPLPKKYSLHQNSPNPFNPGTKIEYELPQRSSVTLTIFNEIGEKVRTLVEKQQLAGKYEILWDGRNDYGQRVATGTYFYQLNVQGNVQTKKMILLK